MELSQGLIWLLGLIGVIGVIAVIGNIQLYVFYRKRLKELGHFESSQSLETQQVPGHMGIIQAIVNEYTTYRSKGIEWMNSQALVEKNVLNQPILFLGVCRLPVGVLERIVLQVPSWVMILGLLGTFSGLTMALFAMQNTLLQIGTDTGEEMISVATIVAAIAEPFRGMSMAFVTSIAGIGTAFVLHVLQSGFLSRLGIGPSFIQEKDTFFIRCESFLDHEVQHYVQQSKPKDSLEKILDRLAQKVQESFAQSVAAFGDEMLTLTQKLDDNVTELQTLITDSKQFTNEFHQGTGALTEFGQVLKDTIGQFQHNESQVAGRTEQLAKQIQQLNQEIKQWTTKSADGQLAFQKMIDRSEQLIQQSFRQSEEMFQAFRQQQEHMQHQFAEKLATQQRELSQTQDEWFYRYQEKNDQFSRAAESFGQAVTHLERQWQDGLERFKRDVSSQWGQLLDKYFGRQMGHNTQDQELREVLRALESINLLLEREFENIYRFSQDANQVLYTLYEWGRSQMSPRTARYEEEVGRPVVRERRY
ncbi:hypothetical protein [Caldalkalibacillus salinus]|uniref:hypothetical protein n=1 Tax=Caldalkalibacillus salinus TaxID=2803787 RepID=UPI0019247C7A|nr:hypothetical protein [Caldalkalibacillus salinus]